MISSSCLFFFFNDTATTEIYTLSLHDALPIFSWKLVFAVGAFFLAVGGFVGALTEWSVQGFLEQRKRDGIRDRKSTRLNSSHGYISYAVFCLKKKTPPPGAHAALAIPCAH